MNSELKNRKTLVTTTAEDRSIQQENKSKTHSFLVKQAIAKYTYGYIMLIDDSDLDNFINEKLIEIHKFSPKIYVNTSAMSALEFFNNLVAMQDKWRELVPDVVFIDINMPMLDGFQFIELFKKTFGKMEPQPKLVMLTSSLYPEDKQRAEEISEGIVFLNKPLTKEMLEAI